MLERKKLKSRSHGVFYLDIEELTFLKTEKNPLIANIYKIFYKLRSPVKAMHTIDIKIIVWFTMKYIYISNLV